MKVAYLCHRVPYPPDKGDKIRAYHQIKAIAGRHDVDLFTLADDPADLDGRAALEQVCRSVTIARVRPAIAKLCALAYLPTRTPLTLPVFRSRVLASTVREAMRVHCYDRVVVYCSAMGQYLENVNVPVISDLVDVDSDKWSQYADRGRFPMNSVYRREARCLRDYERQLCRRSAAAIVTTEREAAVLREFADGANIHVIPNGVDGEFFRPPELRVGNPPGIVFTGDMSYFPNEEAVVFFAREVLPLVRASIPDARFFIVGRKPGGRVRDLAQIDGVEVTGFVADVRDWLARACVSVAPFSIAAGIQNKILEAMAFGLPVVATARTVQGLSAAAAAGVTIAEEAPAFANAVVTLIRDRERARRLGSDGRRLVLDAYNWHSAGTALLDLLDTPTARFPITKQHSVHHHR